MSDERESWSADMMVTPSFTVIAQIMATAVRDGQDETTRRESHETIVALGLMLDDVLAFVETRGDTHLLASFLDGLHDGRRLWRASTLPRHEPTMSNQEE